MERKFLQDQRATRRMGIGNVDLLTTKLLEKRAERREEDAVPSTRPPRRMLFPSIPPRSATASATAPASDSSPSENTSEKSKNEWPSTQSKGYNTMDVTNVALTAERYDVSDTAAAAIASAAYLDAGIITDDNHQLVVDRSKIRRARIILRNQNAINPSEILDAFFFDGRKDMTYKYNYGHSIRMKEEHISILREPGSIFLSHLSVEGGDAHTIAEALLNRLADKNVNLSTVKAIGCDGTNTNTGRLGGILRIIEMELNTPIQWLVCLLHANELPLRVLMKHYVGKSKDPKNYQGPIGSKLPTCEKMGIVTFQKIELAVDLLNIDTAALNTDNKYLINICKVISTGIVPYDFDQLIPGLSLIQMKIVKL